MGADFVMAMCPVPEVKEGLPAKDWAAIEKEVRARLKAVVDADPEYWCEQTQSFDFEEGLTAEDEAVQTLMEHAKTVFDAFNDGSREVEVRKMGQHWWMFTGGMSWGDTPTEIFDAVGLINLAGVFDLEFGVDG